MARNFPQKSLQVKATLLQKDSVLVAHSLLGWALGQHNSRPSLLKGFLKEEELIIASLALPLSLQISSLDIVDNVTVEVLWVSD